MPRSWNPWGVGGDLSIFGWTHLLCPLATLANLPRIKKMATFRIWGKAKLVSANNWQMTTSATLDTPGKKMTEDDLQKFRYFARRKAAQFLGENRYPPEYYEVLVNGYTKLK